MHEFGSALGTLYVLFLFYKCLLFSEFVTVEDRPEMRDLGQVLTQYNDLWRPVGYELKLKGAVLNTIAADNIGNQRECFRVALEKWLRMDVQATWEKLELAITNAKREKDGYTRRSSSKSHYNY